jgi:hypothetical protein
MNDITFLFTQVYMNLENVELHSEEFDYDSH